MRSALIGIVVHVAAILALGGVIGGIAYRFSDDLTELAQSVTSGKLGRAQSRVHY